MIHMTEECKPLSEEIVKDVHLLIINQPATVKMGSKVIEAVEAVLKDPRTSTVYVVDMYGVLKGIITVNDLLRVLSVQVGATSKLAMLNFFKYMNLAYSENVEDIMRRPMSIREDEKLMKGLKLIEENDLTDLPVVDKDNVVVGELNGLEILTLINNKIKSGDADKLV
jgi:CBS domain-containing protein